MSCGCSGGSSGGTGDTSGPLLSGVLHSDVVDSTQSVVAASAASSPEGTSTGLDALSVAHFSGLSFWIVVAAVIAGTWWFDSERRKSE